MEGIIYKYVSPSGKVYIGQTVNEKHRRRLFMNLGCSYGGVKIDNARKKYGPDNFEYTVLVKVTGDEPEEFRSYLNQLEVGFIRMYDSYNNGYNSTKGGEGVSGYTISDETREKLIRSHIGKKRSEESKKKQSESLKGREISEEWRKKIGEANKGKKLSLEHCEKIGKSKRGRKVSDEQKKKMSEIMKGRLSHPITQEMRQKISESMTGRRDSEETKRKKSESAKAGWEKRKTHK